MCRNIICLALWLCLVIRKWDMDDSWLISVRIICTWAVQQYSAISQSRVTYSSLTYYIRSTFPTLISSFPTKNHDSIKPTGYVWSTRNCKSCLNSFWLVLCLLGSVRSPSLSINQCGYRQLWWGNRSPNRWLDWIVHHLKFCDCPIVEQLPSL